MSGKTNEQLIRALYLKGIMVGNTATIELQAPICGRDSENGSIHLANKGDKVTAVMAADSWTVAINGATKNIPLANGKVR